MKTLALTIQHLPGGGYVLAYTTEAGGQYQAHAACSTLPEVFHRLVLPMAHRQFGEQPIAYQQAQAPMPPVDDGTLPRVATGPEPRPMQESPGLMDRLHMRAGSINILPAAWWLGALALSSRMVGIA